MTQTVHVPANTGAAFMVEAGQTIDVVATTIVDLVMVERHDYTHRFDQARTKANQSTIYVTTGHFLVSKLNENMAQIVRDDFDGNHDLQHGMCGPGRWQWAMDAGIYTETYLGNQEASSSSELPPNGCFENISEALAPYGIAPVDIPSPLNIFQHMDIDTDTGEMRHSTRRPNEPATVSLLALEDLLVGVSACPDPAVGGLDVDIIVRD